MVKAINEMTFVTVTVKQIDINNEFSGVPDKEYPAFLF